MYRLIKKSQFNKLNLKKALLYSNTLSKYTTKTKEDIKNKIHKHNIKTVTMGFPDNYGRFIGKKYDSDYFLDVSILSYNYYRKSSKTGQTAATISLLVIWTVSQSHLLKLPAFKKVSVISL